MWTSITAIYPPSDHSDLSSTLHQQFWLRFISNKSRLDESRCTDAFILCKPSQKQHYLCSIPKSYFQSHDQSRCFAFWEIVASQQSVAEYERECLNRSIAAFPNHKHPWLRFLARTALCAFLVLAYINLLKIASCMPMGPFYSKQTAIQTETVLPTGLMVNASLVKQHNWFQRWHEQNAGSIPQKFNHQPLYWLQ